MTPFITWDIGTAYDLLISLHVLHQPDRFGLRPAWAAGVRNRLLPEDRKLLQTAQSLLHLPLPWLHAQPGEKSVQAFFETLAALPASQRLPELATRADTPALVRSVLAEISARGAWLPAELETLRPHLASPENPFLPTDLDYWAHPAEFGERYLAALKNYYAVFFAEEEERITPALQSALQRAQWLAAQMDIPGLVDVLSHGVHFPDLETLPRLALSPSYWITPLIFFNRSASNELLLVFGARPEDAAISPGEPIPAALLSPLKALADPTRLRVLRLLSSDSLTLSQLASRLRLRLPTMVHHLNTLRLAGLVQVDLQADGEKRYTIRRFAVQLAFQGLENFLNKSEKASSQ